MRLLLLSNSSTYGGGYLEHAREALAHHLDGVGELVFVPYALADLEGYTAKVSEALQPLGVRVRGAHTASDPAALLAEAEAIFIGGGNTFRLTKALHDLGLIDAVRTAVARDAPYVGSSAGTNVATPSLRTTNDMPIVEPPSFETLGLVPFQINPHYVDPDPASTHQGETREERIIQFLEENDELVLALREGTWFRQEGTASTLEGAAAGARLFRRGTDPVELTTGSDLSALLDPVRD